MSIFGSILKEVIEGTIDTLAVGESLIIDVVKSPVRLFDKITTEDEVGLLENTKKTLEDL